MLDKIQNPEIRAALVTVQNSMANLRLGLVLFVLAAVLIAAVIPIIFYSVTSSDIDKVQNRLTKLETGSSFEGRIAALEQQKIAPIVAAQQVEKTDACVSSKQIVNLQHVKVGEEPIPAGQQVTFVQTCDDEIAIKWVEKLGAGQVTHYFTLENVYLEFQDYVAPGENSLDSEHSARVGDLGIISYYRDWRGPTGEAGSESDYIVDGIAFVEVPEWTETEIGLIDIANQFHTEAVEKGFFYFSYSSDCQASEYRINGKSIQPGPYGSTYLVPKEGAKLEAFYRAGECGWYGTDKVRWSVEVRPGYAVVGTEDIYAYSMKDPNPWYFCRKLDWMTPTWQPESLPSQLTGVCASLYAKNDNSFLAVMAREGFLRADTRFGDDHSKNFMPFVFKGGDRKIEHTWPEHKWVTVENISLNDADVFTVTLDAQAQQPIISFVGGQYESVSSEDSDIPWYQGWGTEIVFVPMENVDNQIDWSVTQVYRIILTDGKPVIEKMIWKQ